MRGKTAAVLLATYALLSGSPTKGMDWDSAVADFKAKKYPKAATELQRLISYFDENQNNDPQLAAYFSLLGRALNRAGEHKEAIDPLKRALKLNSDDFGARLRLSQSYFGLNNYDGVLEVLGDFDLSSIDLRNRLSLEKMLATARSDGLSNKLSFETWARVSADYPTKEMALLGYGKKAFDEGYIDEAVTSFEKALLHGDGDTEVLLSLGNALIAQGAANGSNTSYAKAAIHLEKVVDRKPTYEHFMQLGEAQLGADDYVSSAKTFERATGFNDANWLAYFYFAQSLTMLGNYDKALFSLNIAEGKPSPDKDPKAIDNQFGFIYEKLKDLGNAETHYAAAGNQTALRRVRSNIATATENVDIESTNKQIEELERQKEELEEKLRELPGGQQRPQIPPPN